MRSGVHEPRALASGSAQAANARSGNTSYLRSTTKVACSTDRSLIACALSVRRRLRRGNRQGGRSGAPSSTAVRRSIAPRAAAPPARSGRSGPANLLGADEAAHLQDLQVLDHRRQRHRQRLRESLTVAGPTLNRSTMTLYWDRPARERRDRQVHAPHVGETPPNALGARPVGRSLRRPRRAQSGTMIRYRACPPLVSSASTTPNRCSAFWRTGPSRASRAPSGRPGSESAGSMRHRTSGRLSRPPRSCARSYPHARARPY